MKNFLILVFVMALVFCAGTPVSAQDTREKEPYSITIDPMVDINPVKTQHTFVATVLDKDNNPLPNQRVEWILARGPKAVGDIVDHDDKDAIHNNMKVRKISNFYTVSYTNDHEIILEKDPKTDRDNIKVGKGQTWLTITSPLEGETHVIAFCPGIKDTTKHKVFAIKYWIDAKIIWPKYAVHKVGKPHRCYFKIMRASNGEPLPGYQLKWKVVKDKKYVPASLEYKKDIVNNLTNNKGEAIVTLTENAPIPGKKLVEIELRKPQPEGKLVAKRKFFKEWIAPHLMVKKEAPKHGILNETVDYKLKITNNGVAAANNVVVKDLLPQGVKYLSSSVPLAARTPLTWKFKEIKKDATVEIDIKCEAVKVGKWTNTVEVTSAYNPKLTDSKVTIIGAPKLYVLKKGPKVIRRDKMAQYTITVKNNGDAIAKNVVLRDRIPAGMKFRSMENGVNLKWNIGNLKAGESAERVYDLKAFKTGEFINTAKVYMGKDFVHKTDFTTKVIAPNLEITKDGPMQVFLNKEANYIIKIVNNGNAVAKDMVAVDTLPTHLTYISSSPRGIFKPEQGEQLATIEWKLGDIQPNSKKIIKVKTRAIKTGRCNNVVKLRSDSPELPVIEPLEASFATTINGVSAMHINSYDTEDPVELGEQTIYVIEVINEGTSACTNVVLTNHVDEEMEFVSASGPQDTKFKKVGDKIVFDAVPILHPADRLTYKIVCRAIKEGSAKNTAVLKYDQFEKLITDEEGTSIYK